VYDYNLSLLTNGINSAIAGSTNAIDMLLNMLNFYRVHFKNMTTSGGCPILNTAVDADDTHPLLKAKAAKSIRGWKKQIETIVKQGIARNEVKPTVVPGEFAVTFISLIEGGIMMSKVTGDFSLLYTAIQRVEKIIAAELQS
jgi:hypothetical protein